MARSPYEEKILEKMRVLNAELALLSEILKDVKTKKKEKENGNSSINNG